MKFKGKYATGIKQFQSSHANTQYNLMMRLLLVMCNLALGKALVVLMQFSYFVKWSITLRPMVALCIWQL